MPKVILVRSPEAAFRPEKWIANHICKLLSANEVPFIEVKVLADFKTLDSQSMFYDNNTMTSNYGLSVLEVCNQVEDGDVIYFNDGWNPAIPLLKSHLFFCGMKSVKLVGLFHSSVETPGDLFFDGGTWIRSLENTIIDCLDTLFVATNYGIDKLSHYPAYKPEKVVVSSLPIITPMDTNCDMRSTVKDPTKIVVGFTHRWAEDKRPQDFIELARKINQDPNNSHICFMVLHPVPLVEDDLYKDAIDAGIKFVLCPTKSDYWSNVALFTHIFSSATLETFGYSIMDAVQLGAIPILPKRAVYPELYPEPFIYNDLYHASCMITLNTFKLGAHGKFTPDMMRSLQDLVNTCTKHFDSRINTYLIEGLGK